MSVEVNGNSIRVILGGCGVFQKKVKAMFIEQGIDPDHLQEWVDMTKVTTVLEELERTVGGNLLVEIGKHLPQEAHLPPGLDTFEKALLALDVAYKMNHRGNQEAIGEYQITKVDEKSIRMKCNTYGYPAKYNLGIIKGFAKRFNTFIQVEELSTAGGGEFLVRL